MNAYSDGNGSWKFRGLIHFTFVKDHQRHIAKVAVVTDSAFLSILPWAVDYFVRTEVQHFDFDKSIDALLWLVVDSEQVEQLRPN